ncbi:MAG: hypothetical protein R2788_22655 [Saprospiraceae bacterium]
MNDHQKLIAVKILHTVIWAVMVAAIFYILYSGWSGKISFWTYVAIGLHVVEATVLLVNNWVCPLTPLARRYSNSNNSNFDIYLPELLAKYNKEIFGTLLVIGVVLVIWRLVTT